MDTTVQRETDALAADRQFKAEVRKMWAMGDYGRFAELVWEVGPVLVTAAGVRPGQKVLDVAAGTGNAAIRAAEAGATVVASDLTPENFDAGRRNAQRRGVSLEWVEADAEALPFEDAEFDVVLSCFGAIFAPRHQRVADELVRVCKPGGTIAMANFTPEGLLSGFLGVFAPYLPPPRPGDSPPVLWGSEDHVRELFGGRVSAIEMSRKTYTERAASPEAYCEFFKETFGPVAAIYSGLEHKPEDRAALDRAFLDFAQRSNQGRAGGPAQYVYEYLLVVARK
ncbi:MAG TPA: methyltransferase domain-containing protein [Burkholderiaceae bacterium]|jgi:ubiquinone/menaquinone biosynthesis C-methylase UbiE|nr:methyltransferase domain-containing protein [Burkholderiaceae bacterium]